MELEFSKSKLVKKIKYPTLKTADSNFSKSRRLECVVAVEDPDHAYARCYTCGALMNIKYMDNGHYIKRGNKSVRFNRMNTFPQGTCCNKYGKGEQEKFRAHLIEDFGSEKVAELELFAKRNKYKCTKIHGYALHLINEESKAIINKICKEKGINKW
jgi:hypothetical protein